jgi:hypothetical protein
MKPCNKRSRRRNSDTDYYPAFYSPPSFLNLLKLKNTDPSESSKKYQEWFRIAVHYCSTNFPILSIFISTSKKRQEIQGSPAASYAGLNNLLLEYGLAGLLHDRLDSSHKSGKFCKFIFL